MAGQGPANSTEYITHHLTHLKVGEGFWSFHVDTIFMSVLLGVVTLGLFYSAGRKATVGLDGVGRLNIVLGLIFPSLFPGLRLWGRLAKRGGDSPSGKREELLLNDWENVGILRQGDAVSRCG